MKELRAHSYRAFRVVWKLNARRAYIAAVMNTHGFLDSVSDRAFLARTLRAATEHEVNEMARRWLTLKE